MEIRWRDGLGLKLMPENDAKKTTRESLKKSLSASSLAITRALREVGFKAAAFQEIPNTSNIKKP